MWRWVACGWRVGLSAPVIALAVSTTIGIGLTFAAELVSDSRVTGAVGETRVGVGAGAGTLEGALALAYQNNPQLNAQRAATRAADENVATALSGYRPRVTGTSSLTEQYLDTTSKGRPRRRAPRFTSRARARCGIQFRRDRDADALQRLQTGNRTRQAEARYSRARDCCARPSRPCCSTAPRPT